MTTVTFPSESMTVESPPALVMDPTEAHLEASRRIKRYREAAEKRRVVEQSAAAQLAEITEWRDDALAAIDVDLERLRVELRPYVQLLTDGTPTRSVSTPYGTAGFRDAGASRTVVEDETAALAWCAAAHPDLIRTTQRLALDALKRRYRVRGDRYVTDEGEVIPGLRVEHGETTFTVHPFAEGRE